MYVESGGLDPFASELQAQYVSGGELIAMDSIDAEDTKVLIPKLQEMTTGHTLYINSSESNGIEAFDSAHISKLPELSKTRQNAFSGIFFGQLSLTGSDGQENTQLVAIKPCGREWLAAKEFTTANSLNKAVQNTAQGNGLKTFQPIAFHRLPTGKIAILTVFEQQVKSFDNSLWVPPERRPIDSVVSWALGSAAVSLVSLHSHGYTHGDFQVKNTAVDPAGPRIIDITDVKKVGGVGPTAAKDYLDDITTYASSLNKISDEYGVEQYVTTEQLYEEFLRKYAEQTDHIFGRRPSVKGIIEFKLKSAEILHSL